MDEYYDFVGASMPKVVGEYPGKLNLSWTLLTVCPQCGGLMEHEFSSRPDPLDRLQAWRQPCHDCLVSLRTGVH